MSTPTLADGGQCNLWCLRIFLIQVIEYQILLFNNYISVTGGSMFSCLVRGQYIITEMPLVANI